ncbi:SpvB/TcaC N-terminal domain-containing protein [Paenibacillus eucommiae]|uniref:RHS repeat-associated protein n=1 Tax=Paenibacillus eucommiae TaxID=1355755 RepID=A0ABS4ISE4_9BACL|nr:SpvB/TcaC N-terminal domain-containing protein [Paenibacillus eucommiae]MBP1990486.1 RHS repeat-associated protein [Paenibacillus eucommiae]
MTDLNKPASSLTKQHAFASPTLSLPKGGGAIRGIAEKFAVNPATGTASMTVPLPVSPGRGGFGPELALSYDSGSGNGPFGFGWSLSLPAITRKTDGGLPEYRDDENSDVYMLSGSDNLVPVNKPEGGIYEDTVSSPDYLIHRYRPRTEGLFSRIERWTRKTTGDIHWRSITHSNVTTLYGKNTNNRIADPNDPTRIFTWLIEESRDDTGNAIVYEYVSEDDAHVDRTAVNERNRTYTANRYLKRIKYGNLTSHLIQSDLTQTLWMFEAVFDYGDGHFEEFDVDAAQPEADKLQYAYAAVNPGSKWTVRPDPFSSYRAGFEVRTIRRCHRMLMFHHFAELGDEPCLVQSMAFEYADLDYSQPVAIEDELAHKGSTRVASFISSVVQSGFVRDHTRPLIARGGVNYAAYIMKSVPPVEFEYSKAAIQSEIREIDSDSLDNLPDGLGATNVQWIDLDGEGVSGILTECAGAYYYKPNWGKGRFGPQEVLAAQPSLANFGQRSQQLLDLAGDGRLDLVIRDEEAPGFYERTEDRGWDSFKSFKQIPRIPWDEPNLRFIDLNGDGRADVLITEQEVFTWYPSLGEEGYGPDQRVHQLQDEELGPRLVIADGMQSIYLADMSGDGLTDLVRIRNGEICYWPNKGYGRFGAKVEMDNAPWLDISDQFNQQRVRLADIDGSGAVDLIYLGAAGARLYFNLSGNLWSDAYHLPAFPAADNLAAVMTADLLGNGTACLVWSSPLPGDSQRPLRYIDLMGGQKPHLLIGASNNLGAESRFHYTSSTTFYLADKLAGKPWITRIPFPVHVIEKVETIDRISGNRFVNQYAYHHGYYDGEEREFRGFGLVEQWDTEAFSTLDAGGRIPAAANWNESSHVPPILTRTWYHTGAYMERGRISDYYAGQLNDRDAGEYYREPGLDDAAAGRLLLPDHLLPAGLSIEEEREACRALKGSMLRQEVYALDGTDKEPHPYTVTEHSYAVRLLQSKTSHRNAVFFTHAREAVNYHYERNPADPRIAHELTLEVDDFGNIVHSAAIGYGRRKPDPSLELRDQRKQSELHITCMENQFTNAVDEQSDYRTRLPCESRSYELTGLTLAAGSSLFSFDIVKNAAAAASAIAYEKAPTLGLLEKRLLEHVHTLYRSNDMTEALPPGQLQSLALPFTSYKLAFTPGLLAAVYDGRATAAMMKDEARYVQFNHDGNWWIPSGTILYSPDADDTPLQEYAYARAHFFLPLRYRNPFHTDAASTETSVHYDKYDLLVQETKDALGNRTTIGERSMDPEQPLIRDGHDYRLLQAALVMDSNRNCSAVACDALGMVVGTAVAGKPEDLPRRGDSLEAFIPDLTDSSVAALLQDPASNMHKLLGRATSRRVYDLFAYYRTRDDSIPMPAYAATLTRETHDADLASGQETKIQLGIAYSDGFGREIQRKIQAEAGPVPLRDPVSGLIVMKNGHPELTPASISPRWVGSGWTIFNNKGKPVRQFEPFFTDTHHYELDVSIGVSPILFYDCAQRVVAALHPNHTWEKIVSDAWRQESWNVADTVLAANPADDADAGSYFQRLPDSYYLPSWLEQRSGGALGPKEQEAALKAVVAAETPTVAHLDSLGRTFLTVTHNKFKLSTSTVSDPPTEQYYSSRVVYDIEGNQREIHDALDRIVMRCDYDMLGSRIHLASMEAGERWTLNDIAGQPFRSWDSRGCELRTIYDTLRRPAGSYMWEDNGPELLVERTVYGESQPDPEAANLRGRAVQSYDQAGVATNVIFDFKGNLLQSELTLAREYKTTLDWSTAVPLEQKSFTTANSFDAMNRPVELIAPDGSRIRPFYNEANLLDRVEASLRGAAAVTTFITGIDYDAKGQRARLDYGTDDGAGISTFYTYNPDTFQLTNLRTVRHAAGFTGTDSPGQVQNLHYSYDPAGNITRIRDDSQQTVFFRNRRVEPSTGYTYDAINRLIEASGREHLGQNAGQPGQSSPPPPDHLDSFRSRQEQPGDGHAMGLYTEQYVYDAAGNILAVQHRGSDPVLPGWTRSYTYNEASQLEPGKMNNRLSATGVGPGIGATAEPYRYDGKAGLHGSITAMPHLQLMLWDYRDQLLASSQQAAGNGAVPETTWYVYDAKGQRVRKVTERQAAAGQQPTRKSERIYLAGFELYREYAGDGTTVKLERETLHIMDDSERIAVVETRTIGNDGSPGQLIRYQLGNHLGSASLELGRDAQILSYEEYYPYGSTSYQGAGRAAEAPKRYRYSGKERDEESGLYYYGARYYVPWLGRWLSCDPGGLMDGPNLYVFVRNNPIVHIDPNGMWTWKQAAIVAAVVTVAVVVTVATAGAGAIAVSAAAAAVGGTAAGATGAAAVTFAGTVAVGAAAGALSGGAADLTAQALTREPGQDIDLRRAGAAAAGGGAAGGALSIIPGASAARAVGQAVRTGRTAAQAVAAARTATAATGSLGGQVARGAGKGIVAGAAGGAVQESTRQVASGEVEANGGLNMDEVGAATLTGAAFGGGGAVVGTLGRAAVRNVRVRLSARAAARDGKGPAAAAVHEPASDQVLTGTNAAPGREMHPLLEQRMREFGELPSQTHPNYYGRPGQQHAEMNALSDALYAREAALGRSVTADDLSDLLLHVQQRSGRAAGSAMPRCSRCSYSTNGVDRTSQLANGEQEQFKTIMSGGWPDDRPF